MGKRNRRRTKRPDNPTTANHNNPNAAPSSGPAASRSAKRDHKRVATAPPTPDVCDDMVAYNSASSDAEELHVEIDVSGSSSAASDDDDGGLLNGTPGEAGSDVEVTFDFFDPTPNDVTPLSRLLGRLCAACALNATALADALCAQTRVGTLVKVEDDGQPVGVSSALDLAAYAEVLAPLRKRIAALGPSVRDAKRVAVIFMERVPNLPPQLAPKMFEALLCELQWATEDEPTPELRARYDVAWFIYVTDVFRAKTADGEKPPRKKSRGKQENGDIAFSRMEDELLLQAAQSTVTWDVAEAEGVQVQQGFTRRKMAMLIKKKNMDDAFQAIKRLFGIQEEMEEKAEEEAMHN